MDLSQQNLAKLVIVCIGLLTLCSGCDASRSEDALRKFLFPNDYSPWALPNEKSSDVLYINFSLAVSQIVDVDMRNQVLTSKVWMKQVWKDYHFVWDPSDYEDISSIKVPASQIWLPDIMIYNNANGTFHMTSRAWANIYHNGTVTWFPPAVYKSACKIDVQYFPFDEQECVMKFGSWTYDLQKIDLVPVVMSAEKKDYWENGEWTIVRCPAERHVIKYPCCEDTYVDVTYTFVLRRKPLFYFAYLLLPCAIISFNTVLVFYLPPDITGKMSLCTSVMLSMVWFLLLITQSIPSNANEFPLIVKYLLFTMTVVSSSIVLTVFILNIRHRSPYTHKMPRWVRTMFIETLPKYVGLQRPDQKRKKDSHHMNLTARDSIAACNHVDAMLNDTSSHSSDTESNDTIQVERNSIPSKDNNLRQNVTSLNPAVEPLLNCLVAQKHLKAERFYTPYNDKNSPVPHYLMSDEIGNAHHHHHHQHQQHHRHHHHHHHSPHAELRASSHTPVGKIHSMMEEIPLEYLVTQNAVEDLMYLTSRSINKEYASKEKEEWKIVAMVIDRIFLIIYLCSVFVGTFSIILEAPLAREFFIDVLFRDGTAFDKDSADLNIIM